MVDIDIQDIEYLRRLVERELAKHDGKIPVKQLSEDDYDKFNGVNIQAQALNPPETEEKTVALYIVDAEQKLSKRFTITNSLMWFLARKTQRIIYGTSDPNGKQVKVILQWEEELREGLNPKLPDGMQRTTS